MQKRKQRTTENFLFHGELTCPITKKVPDQLGAMEEEQGLSSRSLPCDVSWRRVGCGE